jgi:FtsZ-interacting cell division protein ZipA
MNELQIALALIGVLAVIGILIYNRLQERKIRRRTEAGFARPGRDVLLDDQRGSASLDRPDTRFFEPLVNDDDAGPSMFHGRDVQEPHFGDTEMLLDAALSEEAYPQPSAVLDEPTAHSAASAQPHVSAVAAYDESIEFRAVLKNLDGMAAEAFDNAVVSAAALAKPVRWLALPLGSPAWEELSPQSGRRYLEMQAVMQLADRDGPAGKQDLAALCDLARELAQAQGWQVRCDDVAEAAQRAASLDKFCADVDVQIGLNIVARGSAMLPIARMRREAEAAGMRLSDNGVYQLLDSRGEVLFMLSNREPGAFARDNPHEPETKGVTLLFDVPRVPDGVKNFDGMVTLGRKLAHEAGGLLVDDNLRPLTDVGIEKIRTQLAQIYARMDARGVAAGSRLALRLFS